MFCTLSGISAVEDSRFYEVGKSLFYRHAADIEAGIRDQFKKESFLRDEHEEM